MVVEVSEKETVKLKNGKQKVKREVVLADDSESLVLLTVWSEGPDSQVEFKPKDVLSAKGVQVANFQGRSLNISDDKAYLFVNFNHPRTAQLTKFFAQNQPDFASFHNLTSAKEARNLEPREEKKTALSLISEILKETDYAHDTDKTYFFFLNGYIRYIKNDEKLFYLACTQCKRKVLEDMHGYRCEHCSKTFASVNPTYMIKARVSDFTDSIYVNFAREHGDSIMGGLSADDFMKLREQGEEQAKAYLESLEFRSYNMMLKGRLEEYQGQTRMTYFAMKVFPVMTQADNKSLLRRLEIYQEME